MTIEVLSFFSGAGGLDTGFVEAGFAVPWANEYDKQIVPTLQANHVNTLVDSRSLFDIPLEEIPDNPEGIVGGPPCQSWSAGGLGKGLNEPRGQVFLTYLKVIEAKQPKFFIAENVKGMLAQTRKEDLELVLQQMNSIGYNIAYQLFNVHDYGVPQDRWRVIFTGYRKDLNIVPTFPTPDVKKLTLKDAIWDLRKSAKPAQLFDHANDKLVIANHEYSTGGFSSQYMSRNRVRLWDEPSFTIQASGRQAPLHPTSERMVKGVNGYYDFAHQNFRRLTVREAARVQTFPDDYKFLYKNVNLGYKMVGNAVPVVFANRLASHVKKELNL